MKIAALYVFHNGPYAIPGIDLWDLKRDARKYRGPHKVIAHPPCGRWGRYWGGGPMLAGTKRQLLLGDDGGCFAHALWAVRTFGGILEHPEASYAFSFYGVPRPDRAGGWTEPDKWGGAACCVAQGHYGHDAQKLTWLYGVRIKYKELHWGLSPNKIRLEAGFHTKEERARASRFAFQRLSQRQRSITPGPFRDLLLGLVK